MANHHLSVLVHNQAEQYGDRVALKYRDYDKGEWTSVTWNEFSRIVRVAADAMVALGIQEEEIIGVFSQNKPECLYTDFAPSILHLL